MKHKPLVFTDMDGTLLNHDDYRFDSNVPMLDQLKAAHIPVILNTSKTFAELQHWIQQLAIHHPFIIENGSAIFLPKDYFSPTAIQSLDVPQSKWQDYQVLELGQPIAELRSLIQQLQPPALDLTACDLETAMQITALEESEARRAQHRHYSIPLLFSNQQEESRFSQEAQQAGFGILRGGRFLHLMGKTDKGQSLKILKQLYELDGSPCHSIALGDSPNDEAMLKSADLAIVVKSPSSERLPQGHPNWIYTQNPAPEGWTEGLQQGLSDLFPNHSFEPETH